MSSWKSLSLLLTALLACSTSYTRPALAAYNQPQTAAQPAAAPQSSTTSSSTTSTTSGQTGVGPYAIATYHEYQASESMSTVACSDGSNGMIAKGHSTLQGLYPDVGAANFISWNSPQCGACWRLTSQQTGQSVSITVIDGCGSVGGYSAHFDIAPEAFAQLGGSGVADGHVIVSYSQC